MYKIFLRQIDVPENEESNVVSCWIFALKTMIHQLENSLPGHIPSVVDKIGSDFSDEVGDLLLDRDIALVNYHLENLCQNALPVFFIEFFPNGIPISGENSSQENENGRSNLKILN